MDLSQQASDSADYPGRTVGYVRYDSRSQSHDRIDRPAERTGHVAVGGHGSDTEQDQKDDDENFELCHVINLSLIFII
jgi:hypothetical protein